MKRETIFKVLIAVIMGVVLFAKPLNIFAVTGDQVNLDNFLEDQGSLENLEQEKPETTTPPTTTTPETTKPSTNTNTNTNTDIPKAGLVEDTMMVVTIGTLIVIAVFASKKVNEFKNI